jgi:hypothetical protein
MVGSTPVDTSIKITPITLTLFGARPEGASAAPIRAQRQLGVCAAGDIAPTASTKDSSASCCRICPLFHGVTVL